MTTLRSTAKIILWIVLLAIYFNIGWAFGSYISDQSRFNPPQSIGAKFLAGPNHFFLSTGKDGRTSMITDNGDKSDKTFQIASMLIWPIILIGTAMTWLISGFGYLLWLIFGGVAQLLGYK